jgi:hypothetical protein
LQKGKGGLIRGVTSLEGDILKALFKGYPFCNVKVAL